MTPRFSIMSYLFSFQGRINRAMYWAFMGVAFVYSIMMIALVGGLSVAFMNPNDPDAGVPVVVLVLQLILYLPFLVASLAVGVKRWHDRDKSGWWVLISLVPVVGAIWTIVECGFLRGTDGENRFGTDPLGPTFEAVFE